MFPFLYITDVCTTFLSVFSFNNTLFVRKIFILDIEKNASDSALWLVFCLNCVASSWGFSGWRFLRDTYTQISLDVGGSWGNQAELSWVIKPYKDLVRKAFLFSWEDGCLDVRDVGVQLMEFHVF